jgi:hypothetical protein|tara:strand:+ start:3233 stop:3523 length:291 start_codon:yes stop_codon:yes gene_type:complete
MSQSQQNNNSPLVGYCETPRIESRFSLTLTELEDLKRYATQGKEGKPGRVYLTAVSGMSKANKPYNMIKVYDPNAATNPVAQPVAQAATADDGLPF